MKKLVAVIVALACAGCTANAKQTWRPAPDPSAPVLNITGEQGMWGNTRIFINEQEVMQGRMSLWTGEGELEGTWEGKPVKAKCKRAKGSSVRTSCAITIDARKATTLYFRVK
jgi:hypothetical protein